MNEQFSLLEMFNIYQPPEEYLKLLNQAAISDAQIDANKRIVEVSVQFKSYISRSVLHKVSTAIAENYGLNALIIKPSFPAVEHLPDTAVTVGSAG